MSASLQQRLDAPGPKRILAIDGGGVRGAITIGFLERLEQLLRERHGDPTLRLCDYFDFIGGTSAGSVLAAALAIGMEAEEVRELALTLAHKIFSRPKWRKWESLFAAEPLKGLLMQVFGHRTLGDESIETGLCVVAKRADTRSTWPLINHPGGKFYADNAPIPLRDAIYASTAAPFYFVPVVFEVGREEVGAFVDGGVSLFNNPALLLFQVATLSGFPFQWERGEDKLLVVSLGTGTWRRRDPVEDIVSSKVWDWTREVPAMMMEDASAQNQLLLQYLSRTPTPWHIDAEVGDLRDDLLVREPALHYLRYDAILSNESLQAIGLPALAPHAEALRDMSDSDNVEALYVIGCRAAAEQITAEHFPEAFDLDHR